MQKVLTSFTLLTSIFILGVFVFVSHEKKLTSQISNPKQEQTASALNSLTQEKPTFSLLFVGDVMLDRGVKNTVEEKYSGDYSKLFDFIKTAIARSDVSLFNLEGPVSDRGTDLHNLYSFRMDTDVLHILHNAGFNALSFTNNHVGDWGREAFDDTIDRIGHEGFALVGAGSDYGAVKNPTILEKNSIKVGFLGFSDVGPVSMSAGTSTSGILLLSDPNLEQIIKNAKSKVDQLVVTVHWGEEYKTEPTERQKEFGHRLIDWGATLVIGSHPHVIEPTEEYNKGLIAYSLGNFIFDQKFSKETMEGGVLEVSLNKDSVESYTMKKVGLDKDFKPSFIETN